MLEDSDEPLSWRRNLHAIWFTELIAIIGFSVAMPILSLYVQALGVRGERRIRLWAGLIFSAQAVTMAIFGPIWGVLSDRYGRKMMVERAMFGGSAIMALMGLAQNVQQLAILRVVQGCLTGTVTAATALVAATVPDDQAGYALGTLQMAIYAGASVGPLLGGVIADSFGYRAAFFVTSGLLFLAAVAVLILVQEPSQSTPSSGGKGTVDADEGRSPSHRVWKHLAPVLGSIPLLGVLGVRMLMRLAGRLPRPTLPLFVEAIASSDARVATITGLISSTGAVAGAVGGRQLGKLGDRVGYRLILVACAAASILCYLPQSLVNDPVWLIMLQAGAGLAMGGTLASISACLATLAPEGREGVVYGVDASVVSVAKAIAPMGGSVLAAWLGLRAPFLAAAGLFALAGVAAFWLIPRR